MDIMYEDRFEKYLVVFNELKFKYTGIKSKYSNKNKKLVSAWNKAVNGLNPSDLDEMAKDIVKGIYSTTHSEWHKENKFKYVTPELLLRTDKREYWLNEYISNHHVKKSKPFKRDRYV